MNVKLIFPTYRTRFRYVKEMLEKVAPREREANILHLGCGEGDYDPMIAAHAKTLHSCDINAADVERARAMNADIANVTYEVASGTKLDAKDGAYDVVVCIDVIEHVDDPEKLVDEIARVLKKGGHAIITAPSYDFPATYDPVNRALSRLGTHVPIGAYGYGHSWLVRDTQMEAWLAQYELRVVEKTRLTHALAAAVECYWPGFAQKLLKANAGNKADETKRVAVRPSRGEPALVALTDALVALDKKLFGESAQSIGIGYVVEHS